MNDDFYMPVLSHFENDNGWSGSRGLLCYEIEKPVEGKMRVVTWQGPFCRRYAELDAEASFDVTEEGVGAMTGWLLREAAEMNAHPKKTQAECRAVYERLAHGGD